MRTTRSFKDLIKGGDTVERATEETYTEAV